jgi:hypothetical protein
MRDGPWTAASRDKEQQKVMIPPRRKPTPETASHPSKPTVSGPFWAGRDRWTGKRLHQTYLPDGTLISTATECLFRVTGGKTLNEYMISGSPQIPDTVGNTPSQKQLSLATRAAGVVDPRSFRRDSRRPSAGSVALLKAEPGGAGTSKAWLGRLQNTAGTSALIGRRWKIFAW